jgi:hypothetical protein
MSRFMRSLATIRLATATLVGATAAPASAAPPGAKPNVLLKKLISTAIVLAAAAAAVLVAPTPAHAAYSYPFRLVSDAGNNLCMQANGTGSGSAVVVATCNYSTNQMWMFQNGERLQNVAGYLSYKVRRISRL